MNSTDRLNLTIVRGVIVLSILTLVGVFVMTYFAKASANSAAIAAVTDKLTMLLMSVAGGLLGFLSRGGKPQDQPTPNPEKP